MAGLRRRPRRGEAAASDSVTPRPIAPSLAGAGTGESRTGRVRSRVDKIVDALGPRAIRLRFAAIQRKLGITRSGQMALLGAVGLWLAARIIAGKAMYLVAYGAVVLVVLAYVLAPRRLKLRGERTGLFPRAMQGERLDVEVRLNASRRVTTFILEEQVPDRLGSSVRVPITKLSSGEEVSHFYSVRCTRRGAYNIGPLIAVASDPLGLARRETLVCEPFELLVHPRVELAEDRPLTRAFEEPPVRPPVSRPWPSGLDFYGMREYHPGDDVRRIVWRASARTGTIMVREAEQGVTDRVTFVLNNDRGAHSRDAEDLSESFETAVSVVASLGVRHLRDGYEIRCETNSGPLIRPLRGASSQLGLLDALTRLDLSRQPLAAALMRIVSSPQRDAHIVVVTPRLGQAEAAQLKLLLNLGSSVLVVALLWDDEDAGILGFAASLGCQVVGIHPDQDIASALYAEVGARR